MQNIQKDRAVRTGFPSQRRDVRGWALRSLRKSLLVAPVVGVLLSSGCSLRQWVDNGFKVGPNYSKPPVPVASEWIDYRDPRVVSAEQDLGEWWHVFNDPALDSLMESAYQQNISLRVAGARILEARAQRGIAVGSIFPQTQEAFGGYTRNKFPTTTATPFTEQWFNNWSTGFNVSWELDFWGRYRRGIEAADAELDASVENYDDVLVILLADVATNYTHLRAFQERLRYAWQNVVGQYNAYHLAADRYILGAATERDVQQAKQILEQTRALIPQFETGIRQSNNRLCILLGMPPRELTELQVGTYEAELAPLGQVIGTRTAKVEQIVTEFTKTKAKPGQDLPGLLDKAKDPKVAEMVKPLETHPRLPTTPTEVVVGIPADLVRRRPDVRRAERQVAAQSARIGIAESDFYPHIAINGTLGVASEQFGELFRIPNSMVGVVGPSFRWDILNYGRILNNVRAQDARFQELAYAYQNSVLQAGAEAEDAIIAFLRSQEEAARLAASAGAATRTLEITYDQYRLGAVDFTPVVLFESTLAEQQDRLVIARSSITLSLIATYRALGGGWEMRLARDGAHCAPGAPVPPGTPVPPGAPAPLGQPLPAGRPVSAVERTSPYGAALAPARSSSLVIAPASLPGRPVRPGRPGPGIVRVDAPADEADRPVWPTTPKQER